MGIFISTSDPFHIILGLDLNNFLKVKFIVQMGSEKLCIDFNTVFKFDLFLTTDSGANDSNLS